MSHSFMQRWLRSTVVAGVVFLSPFLLADSAQPVSYAQEVGDVEEDLTAHRDFYPRVEQWSLEKKTRASLFLLYKRLQSYSDPLVLTSLRHQDSPHEARGVSFIGGDRQGRVECRVEWKTRAQHEDGTPILSFHGYREDSLAGEGWQRVDLNRPGLMEEALLASCRPLASSAWRNLSDRETFLSQLRAWGFEGTAIDRQLYRLFGNTFSGNPRRAEVYVSVGKESGRRRLTLDFVRGRRSGETSYCRVQWEQPPAYAGEFPSDPVLSFTADRRSHGATEPLTREGGESDTFLRGCRPDRTGD